MTVFGILFFDILVVVHRDVHVVSYLYVLPGRVIILIVLLLLLMLFKPVFQILYFLYVTCWRLLRRSSDREYFDVDVVVTDVVKRLWRLIHNNFNGTK